MRSYLPPAHGRELCGKPVQLRIFESEEVTRIDGGTDVRDPGIATLDIATRAIAAGAPVAIGVSGGKDSSAVAIRTLEYLDEVGHAGRRLLIHSDLGRVEWRQSLPTCERLADRLGIELIVVRRQHGDLLDRFRERWESNVRRYGELYCVKLILPWPTARMRYCTSELKTAVICRELVRRFPGTTILSVSGIRREESSVRAKAPSAAIQPRLTSLRRQTSGLDWHPIIHWRKPEVLEFLQREAFDLHEAYGRYGSSRVSCALCFLSSQSDLAAATMCASNAGIYQDLVRLEVESTFAFQSTHWLADVAPHLLPAELQVAVADAKQRARMRVAAEAKIPPSLLYVSGWPTRRPSETEAQLLAEVRRAVAGAVGIQVGFTTADEILSRYEELLGAKRGRNRD
jgi:3'-phosphoadenosine 5'-phosphosulfate sulfotransferase (PAPS reductase)/FAD synthetase